MFRIKEAISGLTVNHNNSHPPEPEFDEDISDELADQVTPLASTAVATVQDAMLLPSAASWLRDEEGVGSTRHSRASSIVSTRTKYSTNSMQEDARSINIDVGGQRFRISRDGSTITNDDPPPYAPPAEMIRFFNAEDMAEGDIVRHPQNIDDFDPGARSVTPRSSVAALNLEPGMRANILDPLEFDMLSPPVVSGQRGQRSLSVSLVENSEQDGTPRARRPSYDDTSDTPRNRTTSRQADLPPTGSSIMPSRNRRRGLFSRLPPLDTSGSNGGTTTTAGIQRQGRSLTRSSDGLAQVRSAGAILSTGPELRARPRSPDYIGRGANARFPLPPGTQTMQSSGHMHEDHDPAPPPPPPSQQLSVMGIGDNDDLRGGNATPSHTPLPMDTENDISLHYAKMMRKLDYTHRKVLHTKDKEMAELRERLHEKDTVLRQQLRAKDFLIEDLRKRLSNLEENVEGMLERARNEVEDVWESRWKDRDFHLRERMRRIEEDAQTTVERARADHASSSGDGNSDSSLTPS
ncbi:uncharacterized protein PV06_08232 [Exophiala oligosperma]|uniref:Uncharacterized protein n=1 Tax=Exophiala oligosperma TaxID=215243 RepID=A0A0D2DB13_9EURO|nr:uncharacterized protein PV06_08232 [Exophiala oligosperma]KIW39635.1 hypothetical protein PV06_08232 [Exophiala oligosperma]